LSYRANRQTDKCRVKHTSWAGKNTAKKNLLTDLGTFDFSDFSGT